MINLFEYQNKIQLPNIPEGLESFLDEIWNNRERYAFYDTEEDQKIEAQRFIQFIHKSNELKSTKYVGVIHYKNEKINLLPKIFYDGERTYTKEEIHQIHNHILWWLSYCRKIKFPNYQTGLGNIKSDFFEVLIYLFAKYTRELLSSSIFRQYQEISNELPYIKGRLNTPDYIESNLSRGNWHKLNCIYDSFVFDNEFNQIIKFVTGLLFNETQNRDNKKQLREILFILDEVGNIRATAEQCAKIQFNPFFRDFEIVRDYCYLFLKHSVSFSYKNNLKLFAFILPMEYVFEDFVFGFIDKENKTIKAKAQRSDIYLDEEKNFNLRPDLFLRIGNKSLVADTKYKIVYSDGVDPKKGITQSDLYQMLAYAIRFGVNEVVLFYPETIKKSSREVLELNIINQISELEKVTIKAFQLPIINWPLLDAPIQSNISLQDLFEETRFFLKNEISRIFESFLND